MARPKGKEIKRNDEVNSLTAEELERINKSNQNVTMEDIYNLPSTMISIYELAPNPLNTIGKYDSKEELNEFAESVHEDGMIYTPLVAYRKKDGKHNYMLYSGHRRLYACIVNASKYEDAQKMVPVIVLNKPANKTEELYYLALFNEYRPMNTEEKCMAKVYQYYEIYNGLKAEGQKPDTPIREWIVRKTGFTFEEVQKCLNEIKRQKKIESGEIEPVEDIVEAVNIASELESKEEESPYTSSDMEYLENLAKTMTDSFDRKTKIKPNKKGKIVITITARDLDDLSGLLSCMHVDDEGYLLG